VTRRDRLHALAATLLASALAVAGCGHRGEENASDKGPTVPVRVQRIEERNVRATVASSGQWRVSDSVTVVASFRAYVEALRPKVGDAVTRGTTIGSLVTYESRAALRGAEILVHQAKSAVERDEAARALRLAERDLVRVPLLAPATGTVLRRSAEPGSEVAEAGEVLTLVPEGSIVFEAHVPGNEAGHVAPGQRAQVEMEGGGFVEGRVQRRLPQSSEADQTALFWIAPLVRTPFGVLGRFGTATIETGAVHRALLVPDSALVENDLTGEVQVARVLPGNVAVWTTVQLGHGEQGWHELNSPSLPPGTPVVVQGQRGLPDSTRVLPQP